jgi:hypothetical protein
VCVMLASDSVIGYYRTIGLSDRFLTFDKIIGHTVKAGAQSVNFI